MKTLHSIPPKTAAQLLPASLLVPTPSTPRRVAASLAFAMLVFLIVAALVPWTQNVSGEGAVIAFTPDDRPQTIQAPLSGRLVRWHVVEGERVSAGQLLVELSDNDPDRLARLELEREANEMRVAAYEDQVIAYAERIEALVQSRSAQIEAAEVAVGMAREKLEAERRRLVAAEATASTAEQQRRRMEGLSSEGLASQRDRELADLGAVSTEASVRAARAQVHVAEGAVRSARASLERVRASTDADVRSGRASLRTAETQLASARAGLLSVQTSIARQQAQRVVAPREGVVQRVLARQGGVQVSQGQHLAYLVPTTTSLAVALRVDGNDAAIITPGREVRLQFEGWPAVQFAGWPAVAAGTFGGRVAFVDPADDGAGDFRVVVVPSDASEPWPDGRFLRQGTRTKGWVLLDRVSLGFELWRRLNGFPPRYRRAPDARDSTDGVDGESAKVSLLPRTHAMTAGDA